MMDINDIEHILELVRQHELTEFELERDGLKLRVRKAATPAPAYQVAAAPSAPLAAPGVVPSAAPALQPETAAPEDLDSVELAVVKSPIVGTFYRAADPGAPFFIEVGQRVKKDQVLCIIEAMKLMNEITSEHDGELVAVYVENGQPVQYGERLFAIKTA